MRTNWKVNEIASIVNEIAPNVNEIAPNVNEIAANLNFSTNSKIAISKDDHQFIICGTVESSADEHFLLISQL